MATKLMKPVKRELFASVQHGKHRGRQIVMTIEPPDMIVFHIKGTRQRYEMYAGHAYVMAQMLTREAAFKQATELYNERKKAGRRGLRKPKRPSTPFSKMYADAINTSRFEKSAAANSDYQAKHIGHSVR